MSEQDRRPKPSRSERLEVIKSYAEDLRELIRKLRNKLN
jgi:hypothetical protein